MTKNIIIYFIFLSSIILLHQFYTNHIQLIKTYKTKHINLIDITIKFQNLRNLLLLNILTNN